MDCMNVDAEGNVFLSFICLKQFAMFCLTPHPEEAVDLRQDKVCIDRELSL